MKQARRRWAAAGLVLVLAGCGGADDEARAPDGREDGIHVVTTIGMITDLARRIGGDRIRLTGLMGPGVDPHLYKASAGDIRTLSTADLILYNGLHLEAAMSEVLEEMEGRQRTVPVTRGIPEEELLVPPEYATYTGTHDPHVWFDVRLWSRAAETVRDALIETDPEGAATYRANADTLLAEMEELDRWVESRVSELPEERRVLVTAHDAFGYFGRRYDFEVRGLLGISTASEAGTGDVQRLADYIVEREIPAIFVETSIPRRTVEAVQAAVRSRRFDVGIGGTLYSDAMGDPGTPEGTYPGMVRHNVNTIVDALLGRPAAFEEPASEGGGSR